MPLPPEVLPLADFIETGINGVLDAVEQARRGRRVDDGYDTSILVSEALDPVESAMRAWLAISDQVSSALDNLDQTDPTISAQTQAARYVLSQLNIGVAGEVALLQPLAAVEGPDEVRIENIEGWLDRGGESVLRRAALGIPGEYGTGLISMLRTGPADLDGPGSGSDHPVVHAVETILDNTAEALVKVMAELAAGPVLGALIPTPPGMDEAYENRLELVRSLLETPTAWAIEKASDLIPSRVARWAQQAVRRATALVVKVIGQQHFDQLSRLINKMTEGGVGATAMIAHGLKYAYGSKDVCQRGFEAFDPHSAPIRRWRALRLRQLERSNERWLEPVGVLSHTLGPLWTIPMPCPPAIPLAPVAAAVLIAWALLLGGDQLDSRYFPFMIFWNGVVDRASGH
jgi:hypothetical protein